MIVATYFGMFMPALRPTDKLDGDPRELQVRSRRRIDLDRLRERYMPNLGETIALKGTDYQYRAYCTKAEWAAALAAIAADIDYVKFKDTPAKYLKDNALTDCYSQMWGAIFRAFPTGSIYDGRSTRRTNVQSASTEVWKRPSELSPGERLAFEREPEQHELDEIERHTWFDEADVWSLSEVERRARAPFKKVHQQIDHSQCDHVKTRNARRKCRRDRKKA